MWEFRVGALGSDWIDWLFGEIQPGDSPRIVKSVGTEIAFKIMEIRGEKLFPKKGNTQDLKNYRGIGLICCLMKLIERMLNTRIRTFAKKYKLISDLQGRFQKGRECSENGLVMFKLWHETVFKKSVGVPVEPQTSE